MHTDGSKPVPLEQWFKVMTEERLAADPVHPLLEPTETDLKGLRDPVENLKKALEGITMENALYPAVVSRFTFSYLGCTLLTLVL